MIRFVFWFFAQLSLKVLHLIGSLLGFLMYLFAKRETRCIRENLKISQLCDSQEGTETLVRLNCRHTGLSGAELPIAWLRSPDYIVSLFQDTHGWSAVEAALAQKKGLLFITPHIGSYDLAGRFISQQLPFPLTAMYRPPRMRWLEPIMIEGRQRDKGRIAPANAQGVRLVLKALKNAEATIILPDQVPSHGEGVWVPFFNKKAYTMTLAARLAKMDNVATFFFIGERLTKSQGFRLRVYPLVGELNGDKEHDAQLINQNVEQLIKQFPEQYLFSYNRYKAPPGVDKPED